MRCYRLVKARHALEAFTGAGARSFGGRWNRAGTPMVYAAESLALAPLETVVHFPREELYSLTDQIRRSSRSVAANIAEGFRKRQYPNMLASKLADSDGEATETQVWLDFALDCGYMSQENRDRLTAGYEEVGKMLSGMMANPKRFAPR